MTRAGAVPALAALSLALPACVVPALPTRSGGLPIDAAAGVRPGQTKAEVFAALGPPAAIAGPGEQAQVPAALVQDASGIRGGGTFVLQADAALELFVHRRPVGPTQRVYYWYSTRSGGFDWVWILPPIMGRRRHAETSHLWVLLDEADERVVDVVNRNE